MASKVHEATIGGPGGGAMRTATWDVTAFISAQGTGDYTVADIVNQRTGPWLPIASWSVVVLYDLDVADGHQSIEIAPTERHWFTRRTVSWHDEFAVEPGEPVELHIPWADEGAGDAAFAKSIHVVAQPGSRRAENLLFAGRPVGNSAMPGNSPPPDGVVIGTDPACNTLVDVLDDSICRLGAPVVDKVPGPSSYVSAADGRTPTSGSGVDMDVIRIPDRYLRLVEGRAVLALHPAVGATVVPIVLAASIDEVAAASGAGS